MASSSKTRPSRLGRGLSSLMASPVTISPVPVSPLSVTQQENGPADLIKPSPPIDSLVEVHGDANSEKISPGNETPGREHELHYLAVTCLRPNPYQPRQQFDASGLEQLALSIRQDGLMQPVVVRPLDPPLGKITHELVAGERRWRAAQQAGLTHLPCLVRPLSHQQAAEFALIENLQREDLNPLERASAFSQLMHQFHLSHEQIAQRVGMERSTITNLLRLLDLPTEIQEQIRQNLLSAGQAKALLGISHPDQQRSLAERAIRGHWSVRQMEREVRRLQAGEIRLESSPKQAKIAHLKDLAQRIGQQLGTKVYLRSGRRKGTGAITLEFYTLDQFDQIMQRLGVQTE